MSTLPRSEGHRTGSRVCSVRLRVGYRIDLMWNLPSNSWRDLRRETDFGDCDALAPQLMEFNAFFELTQSPKDEEARIVLTEPGSLASARRSPMTVANQRWKRL